MKFVDKKNWYVLYTKPRNEKKVAERLEREGFESYCPLIRAMRQWSDRKKKVSVPMFPSYVFVHLTARERLEVVKVSGVMNFIFWQGVPAIVRDEEIKAVRKIEENGSDISVTSLQVEKGQLVTIPAGPFKGQKGVVDQVNKNNILIYIEQLGYQVRFKYGKGEKEKSVKEK